MNELILSPGEKIKYLRKNLNITLEELAGNKISKGNLSKIENNKINLTEDLAIFLSRKINKIAAEKNIYFDFVISSNMLLETKYEQAKEILDKYIKSLKNNFDETIVKKCLLISSEYNITDSYIEVCKIAADIYFDRYDNVNSLFYAQKGIELSNKLNMKVSNKFRIKANIYRYSFYKFITINNIELKNYNDALKYNAVSLEILNLYDRENVEERNKVYFNFAIIYKNLGNVELALKNLNSIRLKKLNLNMKLQVRCMAANCNLKMNKIDEAQNDYEYIIKYSDDIQLRAICFKNLSECYFKKNKLDMAEFFIQKCIELREKDNYKISDTLLFASEIYIKKQNYKKAEEYIKRAIKIDKNSTAVEKLINLYIDNMQVVKLENLKFSAEGVKNTTLLKLIKFYKKTNCEISDYYFDILYKKYNQGVF